VAKANANVIQISGHDGGTAPLALRFDQTRRSPWSWGLSEVHRSLPWSMPRDRVPAYAPMAAKTGLGLLMAALLGAEEYWVRVGVDDRRQVCHHGPDCQQ